MSNPVIDDSTIYELTTHALLGADGQVRPPPVREGQVYPWSPIQMSDSAAGTRILWRSVVRQ